MSRSDVNVGKSPEGRFLHTDRVAKSRRALFGWNWSALPGFTPLSFDVHIEVDADPLEEAVVEPDEADFDRDLQILQAAKLLEQVGDFFVDAPASG